MDKIHANEQYLEDLKLQKDKLIQRQNMLKIQEKSNPTKSAAQEFKKNHNKMNSIEDEISEVKKIIKNHKKNPIL